MIRRISRSVFSYFNNDLHNRLKLLGLQTTSSTKAPHRTLTPHVKEPTACCPPTSMRLTTMSCFTPHHRFFCRCLCSRCLSSVLPPPASRPLWTVHPPCCSRRCILPVVVVRQLWCGCFCLASPSLHPLLCRRLRLCLVLTTSLALEAVIARSPRHRRRIVFFFWGGGTKIDSLPVQLDTNTC